MTLFLGLLGILQAIFLPGFFVAKYFVKNLDLRQEIILAAPLSLFINFYLIFALTLSGMPIRQCLISVLFFELIALLALPLKWKGRSQPSPKLPSLSIKEFFALLLALISIGKYVEAWARDFGSIFSQWDAVVSWNYWSFSWAHGQIPQSIGLYSQGMPALYSIPYIFLGNTEIQIFSKAIAGCLFLFSLIALLDLGARLVERRVWCWTGIYVYQALQAKFLQSHWNTGYVDMPLASFVIFAFYANYTTPKCPSFLNGILSGSAALVKQPGLLLSPFMSLFQMNRQWKKFAYFSAGATLAILPWFGFMTTEIYVKHHQSNNVMYLAHMVDRDFLGRWAFVSELIHTFIPTHQIVLIFIGVLIGLITNRISRLWAGLFGIPYFFIWGTLFSYDIRNVAMAIPAISFALTSGILFLLDKLASLRPYKWQLRQIPRQLQSLLLCLFAVYSVALVIIHIARFRTVEQLHGAEKRNEQALGDDYAIRALLSATHMRETANILLVDSRAVKISPPAEYQKFRKVECDYLSNSVKVIPAPRDSYLLLGESECDISKVMPPSQKPLWSFGNFSLYQLN